MISIFVGVHMVLAAQDPYQCIFKVLAAWWVVSLDDLVMRFINYSLPLDHIVWTLKIPRPLARAGGYAEVTREAVRAADSKGCELLTSPKFTKAVPSLGL
jgi:hypothetical protein